MRNEEHQTPDLAVLTEPPVLTRQQRGIHVFWAAWLLLALADEALLQVLAWWQVWGHGARAAAVLVSFVSLVLGILAVIIIPPLIVYWLTVLIDPHGEAHASVLVGTYLGSKTANAEWIKHAPKDTSIPIRVSPIRFGVDAMGWGQNWNSESYVQVETAPKGECWIDVYYEGSGRAAQHHNLHACIRADGQGHAVWNWQPQQMPEYVGSTRITANVKSHGAWNNTITHFELERGDFIR